MHAVSCQHLPTCTSSVVTYVLLLAPCTEVLVPALVDGTRPLRVALLALDLVAVLVLATAQRRPFQEGIRDVHLVVAGALQEAVVQMPCAFALALASLEVDVCLPHNLGHVELLLHGELENGAYTLQVLHGAFHLCPLDPGC